MERPAETVSRSHLLSVIFSHHSASSSSHLSLSSPLDPTSSFIRSNLGQTTPSSTTMRTTVDKKCSLPLVTTLDRTVPRWNDKQCRLSLVTIENTTKTDKPASVLFHSHSLSFSRRTRTKYKPNNNNKQQTTKKRANCKGIYEICIYILPFVIVLKAIIVHLNPFFIIILYSL